MTGRSPLTSGDPAPWFLARPPAQPAFDFSQAAGHYAAVLFPGNASGDIPALLEKLRARWDLFDGDFANAFLVASRAASDWPVSPGVHVLEDHDGTVAARFGLERPEHQSMCFVLDPLLRVVRTLEMPGMSTQVEELIRTVAAQPRPGRRPGAPVLQVPRVFEPELCAELIALFQRSHQRDTGFMRAGAGNSPSREVNDFALKRRRDCVIEDQRMLAAVLDRMTRRLAPEIHKAFQFEVTRVERCIIACYDAADGGHFRIHRDNTSRTTAHRRFAVTINLNAEDYAGGDLAFPEFGTELWRPPTGGAAVFSCSLLHEVRPVSRGRRYCFLPFLFDETGERIRLQNTPG